MNFKKLYYSKTVFSEASLKNLKQTYVDTKKIPLDKFENITEIDPTDTNKYVQWMIKTFLKERKVNMLDIFNELIPKFDNLVNKKKIKGRDSDINIYKTSESLLDTIQKYEDMAPSRSEIKRGIKSFDDIPKEDIVFENDKAIVVMPKNEADSCKYGRGSKWCTASMGHSNYFNSYFYSEGVNLYYILPKIDMPEIFMKVAVAVYPENKNKREIFDINDNKINENTFKEIADKLEIPL
jgi:hypothetical protein